jgi:hypothetical protein
MSRIKKRSTLALTSGGWQAYEGAGTVLFAVMDGTSLSSSVLKLYDSTRQRNTDPRVGIWTQDTDFGTTVPVAVFSSGRIVATMGTTSADTHRGIPFANGLYVEKTGDTTHALDLTLLIKPLIKKSIDVGGQGAATHAVSVFDGPGVLHAVRVKTDPADVSLATGDIVIKDSNVTGTGNTLWTGTDFTTAGPTVLFASTTTGIDNAGTAATTAATGAYANEGIAFLKGLHVAAAGLNTTAGVRSYEMDFLIEA